MPINNNDIYPKTTRSVESDAERIADDAFFIALNTGVYSSLYAAKNASDARCGDGKPLPECESARDAVANTLPLMRDDENDNFTGWVGYERTNVDCTDCMKTCSATVFWKDGRPTERMRLLFCDAPDSEIVIQL